MESYTRYGNNTGFCLNKSGWSACVTFTDTPKPNTPPTPPSTDPSSGCQPTGVKPTTLKPGESASVLYAMTNNFFASGDTTFDSDCVFTSVIINRGTVSAGMKNTIVERCNDDTVCLKYQYVVNGSVIHSYDDDFNLTTDPLYQNGEEYRVAVHGYTNDSEANNLNDCESGRFFKTNEYTDYVVFWSFTNNSNKTIPIPYPPLPEYFFLLGQSVSTIKFGETTGEGEVDNIYLPVPLHSVWVVPALNDNKPPNSPFLACPNGGNNQPPPNGGTVKPPTVWDCEYLLPDRSKDSQWRQFNTKELTNSEIYYVPSPCPPPEPTEGEIVIINATFKYCGCYSNEKSCGTSSLGVCCVDCCALAEEIINIYKV